ncbi:hypothetical protein IEO21_09376 [Rhodonia placenta]|uniref:Protein YIP n=1 Tax=Rhodonia placenta TaxID=104341 RepID=A0A8H7TYG9_9APHY|nr:hypothetical protein IEO21_09376 [Postia placenta]
MHQPDYEEVETPVTSTSQFIQADDDDLDEDAIPGFTHPSLGTPLSASMNKGKARASEQLATPTGGYAASPVSGNIGSAPNGVPRSERSTVGGVQVEMRTTQLDTLDEPIATTIGRDLLSIYTKTVQVLYPPKAGHREVLKDWDLWGPLVIALTLGILLSVNAPPSQSLPHFTSVVSLMSFGALVVTFQAQLLGGRISFFQGLCVFGYCVAPLTIAALVAVFVKLIYVRAPVTLVAWAWCLWAAVNFLDGTKLEKQRTMLAVYPLVLFYSILAWMIVIQ